MADVEEPPRSPSRRVLITTAALVPPLLLALAPYGGRWAWWLDMPGHFRVQLALFGLLFTTAVALVAWRVALPLGLATLIAHLPPLAGTFFAGGGGSAAVTVAHANVGGVDAGRLAAWLAGRPADVVFLLEVRPGDAVLADPPGGYRVALAGPREDSRGFAVLASIDLAAESVTFDVDRTSREMATVTLPGPIHVLHAHLARPGSAANFREQQQMAGKIAEWAQAHRPAVVIGDFNAAPWSGALAPLRDAGLAPAGGSLSGTWPAGLPPGLRVPIDHALAHGPAQLAIGPDLGGDHRPVVAALYR